MLSAFSKAPVWINTMSTSDPGAGAGPLDPEILARLASERTAGALPGRSGLAHLASGPPGVRSMTQPSEAWRRKYARMPVKG